jgi:phage head maturation protease
MSALGDALPTPVATERMIEGLVVPYGQWLEVDNPREGHFLERFAPGSLRKSFGLLRRLRGYFEHGKSRMFDRAPIFDIKETWETNAGAFARAGLLDGLPAWMIDGLRRGLYGFSLGAEPTQVERTRFPGKSEHNPKGLEERVYHELRAFDISLTPSPAYEAATVTLRARDYLASDSNAIFRVGIEPVHFLTAPSSRPDYFFEPRDYLSEEDWRL